MLQIIVSLTACEGWWDVLGGTGPGRGARGREPDGLGAAQDGARGARGCLPLHHTPQELQKGAWGKSSFNPLFRHCYFYF